MIHQTHYKLMFSRNIIMFSQARKKKKRRMTNVVFF